MGLELFLLKVRLHDQTQCWIFSLKSGRVELQIEITPCKYALQGTWLRCRSPFEALAVIYILLETLLVTVESAGVVEGEIFLDNGLTMSLPKDLGSEAVQRIAKL